MSEILEYSPAEVKTVYIEGSCLGKGDKITESAKEALLLLSKRCNIFIFCNDKKSKDELNGKFEESLSKKETITMKKFTVEKDENGKEKKIKTYEDVEVTTLIVKPSFVMLDKPSKRPLFVRSKAEVSSYDVWYIDNLRDNLGVIVGSSDLYVDTFNVSTGCKGKVFLVEKHTDWKAVCDEITKDYDKYERLKDEYLRSKK